MRTLAPYAVSKCANSRRAALTCQLVEALESKQIMASRPCQDIIDRSGSGPLTSTRAPSAFVVFPIRPIQPQEPPVPPDNNCRPARSAAPVTASALFSPSLSTPEVDTSFNKRREPGEKYKRLTSP